MAFELKSYLSSKQSLVEHHLAEVLARESHSPAKLIEAMRYSLLAPGKRLRPALVFMAACCGRRRQPAIPGAVPSR